MGEEIIVMSKKEENKETIQYYSGKKTIFYITKKA